MQRSVVEYGLCGRAPLLRELGISDVYGALHIRLEPREAKSHSPQWQTEFSVTCPSLGANNG